ncbi:MAG TPA: tyrosine recombinase XerC [Oscillospiraceae bacterium]|nr:tyrosine recombinase XerC [Oscillospiraceae bacterium]HPK34220.1 tyrosine recombinase XerC [Oscillospiraceae bacterium]HPR74877.1 tyrosine recombinase XerC [Oscillospiraceae bacterium]
MNFTDENIPLEIRRYLTYMQTIRGKSKKTVEEYFLDLRTFFRYICKRRYKLECAYEDVDISKVDLELIKSVSLQDCYDYLMYVTSERDNMAAARARKVSSLKSFYNYLHKKAALISENPTKDLDFPKQRRSLPKYLDLDESIKLLESVDSKHPVRDYCIVTLFLNCGMRLSELVNLNLNDYNPELHTLRLLGKGNKERMVYTNRACDEALEKWLEVRPKEGLKDPAAMFISQQKRRISPKTIQWMLPKLFQNAGLGGRGFSAHKLRHTAATLMYRHGNVDIRVLQELLGHESLATTEIYTHIVNKDLKQAADSNPLAKVKEKTK